MAAESFELTVEALRARRATKWTKYPETIIPAWVADMDFAVADVIQESILELVKHRDYGYCARTGEVGLEQAFADRMRERFGWEPDPELVQPTSELIQSVYCSIAAFSEPGDGVVIQTPIYPPFLVALDQLDRRLIDNKLRDDGTRFVLDVEHLRKSVDDRTRLLLVVNPHNPTGRVFERAELLALGNLAVERDLVIVSDEIHADLMFDGRTHIPMGSLSPEIAARTITITSATKSFNIPGLRCSVMHFGSAELRERFHKRIPPRMLGQVNVVGIDATVAAWRHAQPWLDKVIVRLAANRERVARFAASEIPGVRHYSPEGTYLAWLDCRGLDLPTSPFQFFLEEARVGLNEGADFGIHGIGHVRLNFATSEGILDEVLNRMANAVEMARQPA